MTTAHRFVLPATTLYAFANFQRAWPRLAVLWTVCMVAVVLAVASAHAAVTVVDLMVVYTSGAAGGEGSASALESRIELAVAEANFVFQNSQADVRIRLVHQERLDAPESGDIRTDLTRMWLPNDGWLDDVSTLRVQHRADLVCLVVEESGGDLHFAGLPGPSAPNAFSVIRRTRVTGDYCLAVALSFNFGCQLERSEAHGPGAFPFSYGHSARTEAGVFRSVEALTGWRLPYFSNPDLEFGGDDGQPRFQLGSPEVAHGSAHNARTLNLTVPLVAAFQGAAPQTFPPGIILFTPGIATSFLASTSVNLSVSAYDRDGTIRQVDFFRAAATNQRPEILDSRLEPIAPRFEPLGTAFHAPFGLVWSNLSIGTFHVFAQATDDLGATAWSRPILVNVVPDPPGPPTNDFFAAVGMQGALDIAHVEIISPTNGAARLGGLFPVEARVAVAFPAVQRVDFFASDLGRFASVSNAPYVALFQSDREGWFTLEAVAVNEAGATNRSLPIQVLNVPQGLPNDDFAERASLVGTNVLVSGSNAGATSEPGEPNHAGTPPNHSLWWSYVAPARGGVTVTLESNSFNTAIQIYAGTSLATLTPLIGNWSNGRVNFNVEAGREYIIAMNAFSGIGPLAFRVEFAPPPVNDDFANRLWLVGTNLTARGSTAGASKEPGEPNHGGHPGSVRSIWWSWTAPATGLVAIDSRGSAGIALLSVYTGTSVSNLTPIGATFTAQSAVTYHIAVDSYFQGLDVALNLHAVPPPANDHFANRIELSGWSLSVTGHNYFATHEAGEPAFADFPGGSSVWWTWTPEASGLVRLWLTGSAFTFEPQLRLFTGSSVSSLQWVIQNLSGDDRWFSVVAGTEYQIRLDGYQREASDFVLHLAGPRPPTPPPNDHFANRIVIGGAPVTVTGTTVDATLEPGEPNTLGGSVWWSWTAPFSGEAHIATSGSEHITPFAVFDGTSVTSLTEIVRAPFPSPDSVRFPVVAGRSYQIAAVSYLWTEAFVLDIEIQPGPTYNDAFADRIPLAGRSGLALGSNNFATLESGERPLGGGTGRTAWWSWTAPRTGPTVIDLSGSTFTGGPPPGNFQNGGPLLSIYTGEEFGKLQLIASNTIATTIGLPPFPGQPPQSVLVWQVTDACTFPATAGTAYQFCVDGANGSLGSIALNWSMDLPPSPVNDDFVNRLSLAGVAVEFSGTTLGAFKEPGEPNHAGRPGGSSVWWTWTAPESGPTILTASGISSTRLLAVYTGDTVDQLSPVAGTVGLSLTFNATEGRSYHIAVDDDGASPGPVSLVLRRQDPPLNDAFANRASLIGSSVLLSASNRGASRELGEPNHAGQPGAASVWWTWTAPFSGRVALSVSAPFPAALGVYTGDTLESLAVVPLKPDSPTMFDVNSGRIYQIAVDGMGGASGEFDLSLTIVARPLNDDFDDRLPLSGSRLRVEGTTAAATIEYWEALHPASQTGASVWYTWTALASGDTSLAATSDAGPQAVTVYVGAAATNLIHAAQSSALDPGRETRFHAVAGIAYQIQISDLMGAEHPFLLELGANPPPPRSSPNRLAQLPGGAFRLPLIGIAGQSFVLQTSTNLINWENQLIDTLQDEVLEVIDAEAASLPQRFYRVLPLEAILNRGPLRVVTPVADPGEPFAAKVYGTPGIHFELEASADLEHWIRIGGGQIVGEWARFEDWDAFDLPQRFYRVRPWR